MQIQIDRSSPQPLYLQLVQNIQGRIRSGALPSGARLPTVRELAQQLNVTRLTVHSAYSELQSGGWVEATVGRGTFVAQRDEPPTDLAFSRDFSAHALISDMQRMTQLPGMRLLAAANADIAFAPVREFGRAVEEALATDGAALLSYTSAQGEPLLRTVLADLLRERGLRVGPDEVVITSGVTQGLALVARTLAQPGDAVIVEQPTYLGALNVFQHAGLRVLGVPMDEHGMVVDALEPLLAQRPRFIYTMPVFHNPTGTLLHPARRTALLALAERHGIPIVEDDIYGGLCYEGDAPHALKAEDRNGMVVYISSFSKSLLSGIRIGYIAAAPTLMSRLVLAKQADDLCSPPLMQRALALFIQRGWLANHTRRILPRYRERRDALLDAMAQHFPRSLHWTTPRGGFCSWVTLPPGSSATDLYGIAIERGVAFAPGDVFFAGPAPAPYIRLAFSMEPPAAISEAVKIIGALLHVQQHRRWVAAPTSTELVPFA